MTLLRLVIGWATVTVWFFLWELIEQRLVGPPPPEGKKFRAGWKGYVVDALLLTLFAGLWFASLGHGGWVLLFLMTGLLVEGPARYRDGSGRMDSSRKGVGRLLFGVIRMVVAGGVLAWQW